MNAIALIALVLGVLVLLSAGAWLLKRLRDDQADLLARVASLETDMAGSSSQNAIPLLDQAPLRPGRQGGVPIGEPAPEVTFLDITGRTASLADFRGQDTTLIFWDGSSEECRMILPGLKAVEERPRGLPGILLVVPATAAGNQVVNLRSPVVIDRDGSAARAFGVQKLPAAVLVNARGEIGSEVVAAPEQVLALANDQLPSVRGLVSWAGMDFEINRETHYPRPETESLAEKAVELGRERGVRVIADIGTGSGVIATFLARELPSAHIYGVDVSTEALAVAQRNLERHGVADRVTLLEGSLLEPVPEPPDLITTDIPYLSDELMAVAEHRRRLLVEPSTALYGGPTGLELYRQLFEQIVERGWAATLVLEIFPAQAEDMRELLLTALGPGQVEVLPAYLGSASVVVFIPEAATGASPESWGPRNTEDDITAPSAPSGRAE